MDRLVIDARITQPESAAAARGFNCGGFLVGDLHPCECGCDRVNFGVSAHEGALYGHVVCPVCGFTPDDREFDPVASSWSEAIYFLFVAWNEALGFSAPRELPEPIQAMADCFDVGLGPLSEWRARKCGAH